MSNASELPKQGFILKPFNTLAMIVGVIICLYLAYWQSGRIVEKTQLLAEYESMLKAQPLAINHLKLADFQNLGDQQWQPISAEGTFLKDHSFFLDSQVYKGQPGYHYIVPLKLTNTNFVILVNLGWLSAGADRTQIPPPPEISTKQPVRGQLGKPKLSMPGFEQGSDSRVQLFINIQALSDRISAAQPPSSTPIVIAPIVLLLDERALGTLPREWPEFDPKIEMHEFYVMHWLTAALFIVLLYIYFAYKKPKHD